LAFGALRGSSGASITSRDSMDAGVPFVFMRLHDSAAHSRQSAAKQVCVLRNLGDIVADQPPGVR
jgi:hypothetical protein